MTAGLSSPSVTGPHKGDARRIGLLAATGMSSVPRSRARSALTGSYPGLSAFHRGRERPAL